MKKNLGSMLVLAVVATTAGLVDARPAMAQGQQKIQREIDFISSTKRGK